MNPKNNNLLSYIQRYWKLIVCFLVFLALVSNDHVYGIFGTLLYGPVLFFGAVLSALAVRHWFWRETLDEDAHSGYFVTEWKKLEPLHRIVINLGVVCAFVLAAAWIFAALIR